MFKAAQRQYLYFWGNLEIAYLQLSLCINLGEKGRGGHNLIRGSF